MSQRRSGAPYRRIVVTFWTDPDVKSALTPGEKLFGVYLFTNQHSHPCGLYRLPPLYVTDELGLTADEMLRMLRGPLAPFVTYDSRTEEVFVHAMAEHQLDGNGLHGKDRRIQWVTSQLKMIHSRGLVEAFQARYGDWNLPWGEIIPEPDHPAPSRAEMTQRKGQGMPLEEPRNQARGEGASEGASEASPSLQSPVSSHQTINPPVTSGEQDRAHARDGNGREDDRWRKHPRGDALWPKLRQVVLDTWHLGVEEVLLSDGKPVKMGLEGRLLSDLMWRCGEGVEDPEQAVRMADWMVRESIRACGWDDGEPRTLYWLLRPENFFAAEKAYLATVPTRSAETYGVTVKRMPAASAEARP